MIENYINIRYSLRNLDDNTFLSILPQLSLELENYNFHHSYSDLQLQKDWQQLINWNCTNKHFSSTSRIGMKLCEHFFPNFFDIENNKGESFRKLWKKDNLAKILIWNRKSHSTPYLSEIRRGLYFCLGLTKNTMFRPQIAKKIVSDYNAKRVFDPCAGWGGRMLGAVSAGAFYVAFEPNKQTYDNLIKLIEFLNIEDKVNIINDVAENASKYNLSNFDIVLTSPPYFDLEIYSREETQSMLKYNTYESWKKDWLQPLIKHSSGLLNENGVSCWNVHNIGKLKLIDDVAEIHNSINYHKHEQYFLNSSARQSIQNETKNKKSNDITICYKKSC